MQQVSGSNFTWLSFAEDGALVEPAQTDALKKLLSAPGVSDLVVISHGWKNSRDDAMKLYSELWANTVNALKHRKPSNIVLAGVQWPAKEWDTEFDNFDVGPLRIDDAGGTLSTGAPDDAARRDFTAEELSAAIEFQSEFLSVAGKDVIAAARAFIDRDGLTPEKSSDLFEAAGAFLTNATTDVEILQEAAAFGEEQPQQRLLALIEPPRFAIEPNVGAAKDLGETVGNVFAGPRAAIARFLNQLTYFEMKKRAGIVGARLGNTVLPSLGIPDTVRVHLVGHSFGARLVTAALSALPTSSKAFSLTLLQGAFSHNAMAEHGQSGERGAFANVIGRTSGPISMTHTHNDQACTLWYAIASRLSRDAASAIGDRNDVYGAMGANGAQSLDESVLAKDVSGVDFQPAAGKVNRFLADDYVKKTDETDAHNNVANPIVGKLVAAVVES